MCVSQFQLLCTLYNHNRFPELKDDLQRVQDAVTEAQCQVQCSIFPIVVHVFSGYLMTLYYYYYDH